MDRPKEDTIRATFITNGITIGLGKRLTWPDDFFTLYKGINLLFYDLTNYGTIFPVGYGTGNYNNLSYEVILGRNS